MNRHCGDVQKIASKDDLATEETKVIRNSIPSNVKQAERTLCLIDQMTQTFRR